MRRPRLVILLFFCRCCVARRLLCAGCARRREEGASVLVLVLVLRLLLPRLPGRPPDMWWPREAPALGGQGEEGEPGSCSRSGGDDGGGCVCGDRGLGQHYPLGVGVVVGRGVWQGALQITRVPARQYKRSEQVQEAWPQRVLLQLYVGIAASSSY